MRTAATSVLLADPHPIALRGVRTLLEASESYRIIGEAQNGRDALNLAIKFIPDIAVVAYSLPELNGIELAYMTRRKCPKCRILLYTMHDQEEVVSEAIRVGIRGVVFKSEPEVQLLAALEALSLNRPHFSPAVWDEMLACRADHSPPNVLSHREREVVQLVVEGRPNKQVAAVLGISPKTVENHRCKAMQLELRTTADLVRYAVRTKMIFG